MFTKITFNLINFWTKAGYYLTATPYKWNQSTKKLEIVKKGKCFLLFRNLSMLCSLLFALITSTSFYIHLNQFGFNVNDVLCIFRLLCWCAGCLSILFIFSFQTRIEDFSSQVNMLIDICNGFEGHEPKQFNQGNNTSKLTRTCDIMSLFSSLGLVYGAILLGLLYIPDCRLHFLNVLLPELTCAHRTEFDKNKLLNGGATISIEAATKFVSLLFLQTAAAGHYFIAIGLFTSFFYPCFFYTLEMFKDFRGRNLKDPANYFYFVKIYKYLQVLVATVNTSNSTSYIIPGHISLFGIAFIFAMKIIVRHNVGILMTAAAMVYCSIVGVHFGFTLTLLWRITEDSVYLVHLAKESHNGNNKFNICLLNSFHSLKYRIGSIGYFDKEMYILLMLILIEYTIDALLV